MSYGHPCKRMTGRPLEGPASAYPTFKSPAATSFRVPSGSLDPAPLIAGAAVRRSDWPLLATSPGTPNAAIAAPRKQRRPQPMLYDMQCSPITITIPTCRELSFHWTMVLIGTAVVSDTMVQ